MYMYIYNIGAAGRTHVDLIYIYIYIYIIGAAWRPRGVLMSTLTYQHLHHKKAITTLESTQYSDFHMVYVLGH